MLVTIDAGNSRIKLALWNAGEIVHQAAVAYEADVADIAALFGGIEADHGQVNQVIVSNVGPVTLDDALVAYCRSTGLPMPVLFETSAACCGVRHAYAEPSQHGADRWAAVIAARHLYAGDVCIVDAGTAVTVDVLAESGVHQGGCIMPGYELMLDALIGRLDAITHPGEPVLLAKDTAAAVSGGCSNLLSAGLGRILADIKQSMSEDMLIVLTGGSADELQRSLSASHQLIVEPDLVMHGLRIVSEQL